MGDTRREADIPISGLQSALTSARRGMTSKADVCALIVQIVDNNYWRERVILRTGETAGPFKRFEEFVVTPPLAGLGTDIDFLRSIARDDPTALDAIDRATQQPVGVNQHTEGVNIVNTLDDRPQGNSADYALRKLRADAPEMHARVLAGELSPHAAMVQAGYRKKMYQIPADAEDAAIVLLKKFNADELQQIVEIIANHIAVDT